MIKMSEYGIKDGSQRGRLAGGMGKNRTDVCRNPQMKKKRDKDKDKNKDKISLWKDIGLTA